MKRIILILGTAFITLSTYSQAKRISELLQLNVYDSTLKVVVDKASFAGGDSAKKISLYTISPKIKDETLESSTLNKPLIFMRISDDASNTEYKASLELINPDPDNLSALPAVGNASDRMYIQRNADGVLYYISLQNVAVYTTTFYPGFDTQVEANFGNSAFNTAVDNEIDSYADSTYIIDKLVDNSVSNQALVYSATTYGYISLQKIGNIVVGIVKATNTTSAATRTAVYTLPSEFQPSDINPGAGSTPLALAFENFEGANENYVYITSAGVITFEFNDFGNAGNGIALNWITD